MPGAPEYPVLGGVEYGFPAPPNSFATATTSVGPDFIASATVVYAPTVADLQTFPPFITSVTAVYTPSLEGSEVDPSFISSVTAVYVATIAHTGSETFTTPGTYIWVAPVGVTSVQILLYGGAGGGAGGQDNRGYAGGGGGAYADNPTVPVTPGSSYTFTVGAGGAGGNSPANPGVTPGGNGTDSTFTGDSSTTVTAKGGQGGQGDTAGDIGQGGQASSSIGTTKHSGGDGGAAAGAGGGQSGAGGGASGNALADGNPGGAVNVSPTGGTGANGGGSGGNGSGNHANNATAGSLPGGGGGGGANGFSTTEGGAAGSGGSVTIVTGAVQFAMPFIASVTQVYDPTVIHATVDAPFIASVTQVYGPTITPQVDAPYIASVTTVYAADTSPHQIPAPFISSTTTVYAPQLAVDVPFISSVTVVYSIFSVFDPNRTYGGPGNGGEAFLVELNANGVTTTATLAADIGVGTGNLTMTGDSGLPSTVAFVVTIDTEQVYVFPLSPGNYKIHGRGLGNTTITTHAAGATVSWGDSYDQAIRAAADIGHQFTADIHSTGSVIYPGWLMAYDSTQAYLSGDRYPMHVTSVLGVFDAGSGAGTANRCDAAQPNAISTATGVSDDCAAALSNPSRISSDIAIGDVAVVQYTNPEATPLDLGPRSVSLQSWFGLKRVDLVDNDVTFTDPNGIVVDTTGTYDTFTGSVNGEWLNPSSIGVNPNTGLPTLAPVPYTTVTLLGIDRKFTYGTAGGGYDEKGWPICCLAVRQGNRRVPYWQSWDWHDFSYVYCGFGTDCSYAQVLINRNGINYNSVPDVNFPGPQDTDGPDAVWDDGSYHFGASWYVVIYNTPYLVAGPTIGGSSTPSPTSGVTIPTASFPSGGGAPPSITYPPGGPPVEGGSGGGIGNPPLGLHVWGTSGKGFS